MNSQQLILDRIQAGIDAKGGLVLANDAQYANRGHLRVYDAATLAQVGSAPYDFQQTYCSFGPMSNRIASHWYGEHDVAGKAAWVKGSIPDLVDAIVAHLTAGAAR